MQIFILDENPETAAKYHCDKHVIKMILEGCKLLCTAHHINGSKKPPYRKTHENHPCAKWVRESKENYLWLVKLTEALLHEYTDRYGKIHKSEEVLNWLKSNMPESPKSGLTPFALAIPDEYKKDDAVLSYRAFYLGEKKHFAEWRNGNIPFWFY